MNIINVARVIKHIQLYPETHDQMEYHSRCGTRHCFAGLAQIMAGYPANSLNAAYQAACWLGLTESEERYLFAINRTLVDFITVATTGTIFNAAGYNTDGFDEEGFDEEGYDMDGYNTKGFDEEGYDVDGYNTKGFDDDGYDKNGFSARGYDIEGYNEKGFNAEGVNKDGRKRL